MSLNEEDAEDRIRWRRRVAEAKTEWVTIIGNDIK